MIEDLIDISIAAGELQLANDASQRLSGVRQKIRCAVNGNAVSLTGAHNQEDLEHCWRIALLNERLHQAGQTFRSEVLAELIA